MSQQDKQNKQDKHAIYERAQMGHKLGYGKKPAIVVVDFQLGFTAPEQSPLASNLDAEVAATNEIIAAARTLFIETGYEDTSISRLAAAAGVAPNTIYWYFKDKDEARAKVPA